MHKTKKVHDLLEQTYYNLSRVWCIFRSRLTLLSFKIQKQTIRKWLHNQDSSSLRTELRRRFTRTRVVVSGIHDQFDMVLIDISNIKSSGVSFLLVDIDIFSKYLWIETLKNKTAKEVITSLTKYLIMKYLTRVAVIRVLSSITKL